MEVTLQGHLYLVALHHLKLDSEDYPEVDARSTGNDFRVLSNQISLKTPRRNASSDDLIHHGGRKVDETTMASWPPRQPNMSIEQWNIQFLTISSHPMVRRSSASQRADGFERIHCSTLRRSWPGLVENRFDLPSQKNGNTGACQSNLHV
jgi:hypothetical protein